MELKKFNEKNQENNTPVGFSPDKPYIVLVFDASLKNDKSNGYVLKGEPIWDMKQIKNVVRKIQYQNIVLGRNVNKIVEIEKHNFTKWEELPIDWT